MVDPSTRHRSRRAGVLVVALLAAVTGSVSPVPAATPESEPTPTTLTGTDPATTSSTAAPPTPVPPTPVPPTPVPPTPAEDPVLLGAGDITSCADRSGAQATAAILDRTPGSIFTLGDNVYVDGTPEEFANCYAPDWGRFKPRTTFAVAGNHDYNTPGAAGYYGYFGAAAGDPAQGYYDARVGAWHVIVLNSNCEAVGGCGAGSPQEQWLRSVLAGSDARCTLAMWHNPGFSSATVHRAFPTYQPFWQALYEYGAEVVLAASDHVYERFGLQNPAGDADPLYGLRQFTVGTGGRSHQLFKSVLPNSEVRNGATYGVISLTLHDDSYDWRFIPEAGKEFSDSGTGACHGAPPPPPDGDAPIGRVGSSSGSAARARALTLARPAGTQPGDVMVASVVASGESPGFIAPAGWNVVRDDAIHGVLRQAIYLKVGEAVEPVSYTWSLIGRGRVAGGLTAYSGVDAIEPIDAVAASIRPVAKGNVRAPSITTTVADSRLVHFAAVNAEGTIAAPEGMIQRWLAASPGGDVRDALAASFDVTHPGIGATGRRVARATEAGARIGVLLALRPSPSGTSGPPPERMVDQ